MRLAIDEHAQHKDVYEHTLTVLGNAMRLEEDGPQRRILIIGNERWPFPVPLVETAGRWAFDAAAGREEVIARRIGRNELMAIRVSRLYVAAQRLYASEGFVECGPFADYVPDPFSVFMTRRL